MRHLLAVLSAALVFTPVAHATQTDDFVLTTAHHTYTFSLTTPYYTGPTYGHYFVSFPEFGPGTIDGVGGYTLGGYFYNCCRHGIDFDLPNGDTYQLIGPDLSGFTDPFLTGTFHYTDFPFDNPYPARPIQDGPYTLTITPETSTTVTPEPATLTLLATGSLGLLTVLRRRLLA
jgi:hypothetical protein